MIEQAFELARTDEKTVEKILWDDNLHYMHMVIPQGDGLPVHDANSTVYMSVIRGELSIGLNDQEIHRYPAGTMLKIPFQTTMNVRNNTSPVLELIVIKSPAPR